MFTTGESDNNSSVTVHNCVTVFRTEEINQMIVSAKAKGTKWFSNPKAQGYSVPSTVRTLLRAWELLNCLVPLVIVSNLFRQDIPNTTYL